MKNSLKLKKSYFNGKKVALSILSAATLLGCAALGASAGEVKYDYKYNFDLNDNPAPKAIDTPTLNHYAEVNQSVLYGFTNGVETEFETYKEISLPNSTYKLEELSNVDPNNLPDYAIMKASYDKQTGALTQKYYQIKFVEPVVYGDGLGAEKYYKWTQNAEGKTTLVETTKADSVITIKYDSEETEFVPYTVGRDLNMENYGLAVVGETVAKDGEEGDLLLNYNYIHL